MAAAGAFVLACLTPETQVAAQAPIRIVDQVNATFKSRFWSAACGSPVFRTQVGTAIVTVHSTDSGAFEMDTLQDWTETLTAPSTGGSFTQRPGPVRYEYPDGIYIGAPARVILLGKELTVPGLPADAGRVVYTAEIVFMFGAIPIVDITGFESSVGHFNDPSAYIEAGCTALGF